VRELPEDSFPKSLRRDALGAAKLFEAFRSSPVMSHEETTLDGDLSSHINSTW
jgi:hypothetical protein